MVENPPANAGDTRDMGLIPESGRFPGGGNGQPTLKFLDCSPPGSSVHGIFQARVLEWVATFFSRGSSQPRDRIWVFCIAGGCGRDKPDLDAAGVNNGGWRCESLRQGPVEREWL